LVTLFFFPFLGGAVGWPGVEALFYSRFGAEFLPYMYIALGGITLASSLLLAWLLGRLSRRSLYLSLPPVLALSLIISRILIAFDPPWFYPVLWLWIYLVWTLQTLFTWGLAGMVCDMRQAKRLFPLFGAGSILGIAIGGLLTEPLALLFGAENLLLFWASALLATVGLVFLLLPNVAGQQRSSRRAPTGLLSEVLRGYYYVRRTSLMRWLAVAAVLLSALNIMVAFPYAKAAAAQFTDEDQLAGFLGALWGSSTALALLVSLLLANRLYARFGFISAILIFAVIYLLGFGAMLFLNAAFIALAVFRFVQMVWLQSVADTAFQSLFSVVPDGHREQTRAFIRGVPEQLGIALTGMILVVGSGALDNRYLFILGTVAAMVMFLAMWRGREAYRGALVEALRAGQPSTFFSDVEPFGGFRQDAQAVEIVVSGITDADPAIRQVSVEILGHLAVPAAVENLLHALKDSEPDVRAAALSALARTGANASLPALVASLQDASAAARLQAVAALAAVEGDPEALRAYLEPSLQDSDLQVRTQAAAALLRSGPCSLAENTLHKLGSAEDMQSRIYALEAYASAGVSGGYDLALVMLKDPLPPLRKTAATALSKLDAQRSVEPLLAALADEDHSVREAVAIALVRVGERVRPGVMEALAEAKLEDGALLTLRHLPLLDTEAIRAYTRRKVAQALEYHQLWQQLAPYRLIHAHFDLLANGVSRHAQQQAIRALQGMSLLQKPDEMQIIVENLNAHSSMQRGNALELLDSLPERETIRPLLPLWETDSTTTANRSPGQSGLDTPPADALLRLLNDPDWWLRACAILAAAVGDRVVFRAELQRQAKSTTDPLLTETIRHVLAGVEMDTLPTIPMMQRILYLQRVPLFESLSPADLKQIAAIAGEHFFLDGEVIARQGDVGEEMYIIVSGAVEVRLQTEDGREVPIALRQPGDHVGEMAVISNEPRMASLVARGDVRALCVEQKPFEAMLRERPEISLAVMRKLIGRLREARSETANHVKRPAH
jgi:HEAT repeat protein